MGEQLNHTSSEKVYFYFSKSSVFIAQSMDNIRGVLNNIWVISWIESISRHGLGNFDFVLPTGVLHHLNKPQKGLSMLNDVQYKNGGTIYMVCGKIGRTGLCQIQEIMRMINGQSKSMDDEIHSADVILEMLSEKDLLRHFTF